MGTFRRAHALLLVTAMLVVAPAAVRADGWSTNSRQGGALTVVGRSANSAGNVADIAATAASGAVLRESGSTIGFGTINGATAITSGTITRDRMAVGQAGITPGRAAFFARAAATMGFTNPVGFYDDFFEGGYKWFNSPSGSGAAMAFVADTTYSGVVRDIVRLTGGTTGTSSVLFRASPASSSSIFPNYPINTGNAFYIEFAMAPTTAISTDYSCLGFNIGGGSNGLRVGIVPGSSTSHYWLTSSSGSGSIDSGVNITTDGTWQVHTVYKNAANTLSYQVTGGSVVSQANAYGNATSSLNLEVIQTSGSVQRIVQFAYVGFAYEGGAGY